MGRHVAHGGSLARRVRSVPRGATEIARRAIGMTGDRPGFGPRDLTTRPRPAGPDRLARAVVGRRSAVK
jgi:hypothetical protein